MMDRRILRAELGMVDSGLAENAYFDYFAFNPKRAKQTLEKGILQGDPRCAYVLASFLRSEGDAGSANVLLRRAVPLLEQLAKQGDGVACALTGACYRGGIAVREDWDIALKYYKKGVKTKNPFAALLFYRNILLERLYDDDCEAEDALDALLKFAEQSPRYAYALGTTLLECRIVQNAKSIAVYQLQSAADRNHDGACMMLAMKYAEGKKDLPQDPILAYQYCHKALLLGNETAKRVDKKLLAAAKVYAWVHKKNIDFAQIVPDVKEACPEYADMLDTANSVLQQNEAIQRINKLSTSSNPADQKQAIEELEKLIAQNPAYEQTHGKLLDRLYGEACDLLSGDADETEWLLKAEKRGNAKARFLMGVRYYEGNGVGQDFGKALYRFKKSIESGTEEGLSYFYLANCYAFGYGLKKDLKQAREYYKKAMEYGVNCQYALDSVQYQSPGYVAAGGMQEYAEKLLLETHDASAIYNVVARDMQKAFGNLWGAMPKNAQSSITTGIAAYISFYAMGKDATVDCDFSIVINSVSKALEIVLSKIFFTDYIRYLKKEKADVKSVKGLRNYAVKSADGIFRFPNETDISLFSLGGARHILDVQGLQQFLEGGEMPPVLKYADTAFGKRAFSQNDRAKQIAEYLKVLADEILTIREYRNPAAHGKIMTCKDAEVCADTLVLVKKMIYELLEKTKKR